MATFGTDTKNGVPVSYAFSYGGEDVAWGTSRLYKLSDLSNSSEPINKKRKIPGIQASFVDPDGLIWGSMGNGTGMFGSAFNCTISVGGTMDVITSDVGTGYGFIGTTGANDYTVFQGHIDKVSRGNNLTTIHAQNIFRYLSELRWQFPMRPYAGTLTNASGSTSDISGDLRYDFNINDNGWDEEISESNISLSAGAGSTVNDVGRKSCSFSGVYVKTTEPIEHEDYLGTGLYDISLGDGIEDILTPKDTFYTTSYTFTDTQFALKYSPIENKQVTGTIVTTYDGGTTYSPYNKIEWNSGTADVNAGLVYPLKRMRIAGDPIAILKHLIFGKMVTDYLDYSTQTGDTFDEAQRVSAFKYYEQTLLPTEVEVMPFIDNLLETERAMFYLSTDNKFEVEPYGPKFLSDTLPSIGSAEIISAETTNDVRDYYNKVTLNYGYNESNKTFLNSVTGTQDDWTILYDQPLIIESKWLRNGNQAKIALDRILSRYKNTNPKISFSTPLTKAGYEVGTLVKITDEHSSLATTTVQITSYNKRFSTSKQIGFEGWNGDALWRQKGYGRWEGEDNTVSGTSKGGWGTNGTVHNIDTEKYGTQFLWW